MFKFKLSRLIFLLVTTMALVMSACGDPSSLSINPKKSAPIQEPKVIKRSVIDETVAINTYAVKGIMIGADVTATDSLGNTLATSVTDEKGHNKLEIPEDYLGVIKVTVTANKNTIMRCGSSDCGNGIGFGETISNIDGLTLSTLGYIDKYTAIAEETEFPVNMFTDLTTRTIKANIALDQINIAGQPAYDYFAQVASKKIGVVLGLSNNLIPANFLTQKVIGPSTISNLTADPAIAFTKQGIRLSMINASLLEVALKFAEQPTNASSAITYLANAVIDIAEGNVAPDDDTSIIANYAEQAVTRLANNPLIKQEFTLLSDALETTGKTTTLAMHDHDFDNGLFAEELASTIANEIDHLGLTNLNDALNNIADIINDSQDEVTVEKLDNIKDMLDTVNIATDSTDRTVSAALTNPSLTAQRQAIAKNVSSDFFNAYDLSVDVNKQIIRASNDIRHVVHTALINFDVTTTGHVFKTITIPETSNGTPAINYSVYIKKSAPGSIDGLNNLFSGNETGRLTSFYGVITSFELDSTTEGNNILCTTGINGFIEQCLGEDGSRVISADETAIQFNVSYNLINPVSSDPIILSGLTFKGQAATPDATVTFGKNTSTHEHATVSITSYDPSLEYFDLAIAMYDTRLRFTLPKVAIYTGDWNKKLSGSVDMTFQYSGEHKSFAGANVLKQGNVTLNADYIEGTKVSDYQIDGEVLIYEVGDKKKVSKTVNVSRASQNYVMTLKDTASDAANEGKENWCSNNWLGDIKVASQNVAYLIDNTIQCQSSGKVSNITFNIGGTIIEPTSIGSLMKGLGSYFDSVGDSINLPAQ